MRLRCPLLGAILWSVASMPLGAAVTDDRAIPPAAVPAFDRGFAAAGRGEWAEAVRQFLVADETAPATPIILFNLGLACAKTGRHPAAVAWWQAYLVAARDAREAEEVRNEIQAVETAAMVRSGKILARALIEARRLPEPADTRYAMFRIAGSYAEAGNIQGAFQILDDTGSRRLGAEDGDRDFWRLYFTSLFWSRDADKMVRSLDRLPASIDRNALLAEYVPLFSESGQFDSARLLASKIADPDLRLQLDSQAQSAQERDDDSNKDITPADMKSAAVEEWSRYARKLSAYRELADEIDRLIGDEYLLTGAVTIKRTIRDIPVQLANLANSQVTELLLIRGRRRKEAERANHFYQEGYRKEMNQDYPGALAWFDRALALNPYGSYEVCLQRAEANREAGDAAGALADYGRAIALNPHRIEAFVKRGALKDGTGDYDGAIADYGNAVAVDPGCAVAYYNRGLAAYKKGDYALALADSEKAIRCAPGDAQACNMRGAVRQIEGDTEGAAADYGRAIELDPAFAIARSNRGALEESRGDLAAALADYDQAVKLSPGNAVLVYRRGMLKVRKEDYVGAIADFDRALEIHPDFVDARSKRADAKGHKHDAEGAFSDFVAAGETRWKRGDLDGAFSDLGGADLFDDSDPRAHFLKGEVEQTLGYFEDALGDYDVAIREGGDEPFVFWVRLHRHVVLRRLGRGDDDLARVVAKWDQSWEKTVGLFLAGRLTESELLAKAAAETYAPLARVQLCKAYYFAGMERLFASDLKTARAMFEKCVAMDMQDVDEYEFSDSELARIDGPRAPEAKQEESAESE